MIEKTVIILGAGASKDYGFPVGNALIKNILNNEKTGAAHIETLDLRQRQYAGIGNRICELVSLELLYQTDNILRAK